MSPEDDHHSTRTRGSGDAVPMLFRLFLPEPSQRLLTILIPGHPCRFPPPPKSSPERYGRTVPIYLPLISFRVSLPFAIIPSGDCRSQLICSIAYYSLF